MNENSSAIHQEWVNSLRKNGLAEIVLFILQAFKPLSYFSSQLIYTGTPLLKFVLPNSQIRAAGSLMDDSGELDHFMAMLSSKE
jgi:hypothetical protein